MSFGKLENDDCVIISSDLAADESWLSMMELMRGKSPRLMSGMHCLYSWLCMLSSCDWGLSWPKGIRWRLYGQLGSGKLRWAQLTFAMKGELAWYGMYGVMEDGGVHACIEYRKWYSAEKIRTGRGQPEDLPRGTGSRRYTSWMMVYIVGSWGTNHISVARQCRRVRTWRSAQDFPELGN